MIVKDAWPYVLIPGALGALVGHFTRKKSLLYTGLGVSTAMAYFFRDPDRYPPFDREVILAPADGKIVSIHREKEERFLETEVYRIGIFMNLFDVHVNRSPVTGRVLEIIHEPGQFLPADREEAFRENEKRYYLIERLDGIPLLVVQIAGLVARRTVPFVQKGDEILACERLGMIRFGSRVEVLVPSKDLRLLVNLGHRVRAGESPLAILPWQKNA